jgi:uncharacterized membrane protein
VAIGEAISGATWSPAVIEEARATINWRTRAAAVDRPVASLVAVLAVWLWTMGLLVWRLHARFRTLDYDLGIYDQSTWLLAHGKTFNTIGGSNVLGGHASFGLYLFAPFYWLGAGPQFLDLMQLLALAAGAVIVFWFARRKLDNGRANSGWHALVPTLAYLAHPTVTGLLHEGFHPEVMAIPFVLLAYVMAHDRRWGAFAMVAVLAVLWKEDVALAMVGIGLVVLLRRQWRAGVAILGTSVGYFLLTTSVLIPHFGNGATLYSSFFGDVGGTPSGVAKTVVTDPGRIIDKINQNDGVGYGGDVVAPYGYLPLLSPLALAPGGPQWFINSISAYDWIHDPQNHYVAMPFAAATIAAIEALALVKKRLGLRRFMLGVMGVSSLITMHSWGSSPLGVHYRDGAWPVADERRQADFDVAVSRVPNGESVSATYGLVSHLAHRELIMSYPNPWHSANFGVESLEPDPNKIKWLVLDLGALHPGSVEDSTYNWLRESGQFAPVFTTPDVVVAQRVAPGDGHAP